MKSFEQWLTQEVKETFGVFETENDVRLAEWLAADEPISTQEWAQLEPMRHLLVKKVKYWNEDELKFFFISGFLNLVDFNSNPAYSAFTQRTIAATLKNVRGEETLLRGRVEWLVATGEQIPREPFLFIHEYKPTYKTTPSDPLGQLLIAMVAAQALNKREHPLYGIYVNGKDWHFVTFQGKTFAESRAFDVTQAEQFKKVFSMLKFGKKKVEQMLGLA